MSINPYWLMKILNGEKTLEIRKTVPNAKFPIDVYLYCTKGDVKGASNYMTIPQLRMLGRVVAKFTLNKVDKFEWNSTSRDNCGYWYDSGEIFSYKGTGLNYEKMFDYVGSGVGYAWHIDKLKIFQETMWLYDFKPVKWDKCDVKDKKGLYQCDKCPYGGDWKDGCRYKPLEKPPISWQFVEVE